MGLKQLVSPQNYLELEKNILSEVLTKHKYPLGIAYDRIKEFPT